MASRNRGGPLMLARRVIPCLDIDNGRIVKGMRFQNLRDAGDPVTASREYEAQGADEIVLLDVSATPGGRSHNLEVVERVRGGLSIPLLVGGGVRSVADGTRLLEAGADRIGVNTAAVDRPGLITELTDRFGAQCIVVAIDAATRPDGWEVMVQSGSVETGRDVVEWSCTAADLGAGEILLTSWDRDGTGEGYDIPLIAQVANAVNIPVIASGGAKSPHHLREALLAGASAVLVASILHDCDTTISDLKTELASLGIEVRP